MQRTATTQHRTALLRDALAVMEAEYARDLSLDDVATRIATSRRQLQRCFREHGGASFRTRLATIRMARAAELLERTDWTVRMVAYKVGYRQPAQFAKAFARHRGLSPSEFRASTRAPRPGEGRAGRVLQAA